MRRNMTMINERIDVTSMIEEVRFSPSLPIDDNIIELLTWDSDIIFISANFVFLQSYEQSFFLSRYHALHVPEIYSTDDCDL